MVRKNNGVEDPQLTAAVVGIQYYYLAKIFLKAYKPSASVFGFGACRENREIEVRPSGYGAYYEQIF